MPTLKVLLNLEDHTTVTIDGQNARRIDDDVIDVLEDFKATVAERNLQVVLIGLDENTFQPVTTQPASMATDSAPAYTLK